MEMVYKHGQKLPRVKNYLLLARHRIEEGQVKEYHWFNSEDELCSYLEYWGDKLIVDYAGEVKDDRKVVQREFDRNLELSAKSKEWLDEKWMVARWEQQKLLELAAQYGIDALAEQIAGYPLVVFFHFLSPEAELSLKGFFPPDPKWHDLVIDMFVEAIANCEDRGVGVTKQFLSIEMQNVCADYSQRITALEENG